MSYSLNNTSSETHANVHPDDWKINMSDAWQVLWWCRYLGLTKSQLEQAIHAAGSVIVDVKQYVDGQLLPHDELPSAKAPSGASHVTSRSTLSRSPF